MSTTKKFLYVNRKAPHGSIYALESLEVVLIGAAFEQDVSLAFIDDGVYQLMLNQDPSGIGVKNFSLTYKALGDFDINQIYVEKESLELRGLSKENMLPLTWEDEDEDWTEKDSIQVVSSKELTDIIEKQDVIFNF